MSRSAAFWGMTNLDRCDECEGLGTFIYSNVPPPYSGQPQSNLDHEECPVCEGCGIAPVPQVELIHNGQL